MTRLAQKTDDGILCHSAFTTNPCQGGGDFSLNGGQKNDIISPRRQVDDSVSAKQLFGPNTWKHEITHFVFLTCTCCTSYTRVTAHFLTTPTELEPVDLRRLVGNRPRGESLLVYLQKNDIYFNSFCRPTPTQLKSYLKTHPQDFG